MAKQYATTATRPKASLRQGRATASAQPTRKIANGGKQGSIVKMDDPIGTATVTVGALNVRSDASTSAPRIGGLTNNKTVSVYESKDGWLRIGYGTGYGWICQKYTNYQDPVVQQPEPTQPEPTQPEPEPTQPEPEPTQPEPPATESFEIRITGASVYIRPTPDTNGTPLGVAHDGDTFTAIGVADNGWFKIIYNGKEAWVSNKFAVRTGNPGTTDPGQPTQPSQPSTGLFDVIVSADTLNVRTGPGIENNKIGSLSSGTKVTVYEEKNGWYRIDYGGKEGWISASYTYKEGAASEAGQKAANFAYSLMSTCNNNNWHYNQSKRTVDGYYDCSAFTHRCWAAAGYSFNWANSVGQAKRIYDKVGEINRNDVQPGDLLFYHNNWNSGERWRDINHVAIAVGGGKRVDAGGEPVREVNEIGETKMIGRPSLLM